MLEIVTIAYKLGQKLSHQEKKINLKMVELHILSTSEYSSWKMRRPSLWKSKLGNSTHLKTLNNVHNTNHNNSSKQFVGWPPLIPLNCEQQKTKSMVNTIARGLEARPYQSTLKYPNYKKDTDINAHVKVF
jgi:hypothetical protein